MKTAKRLLCILLTLAQLCSVLPMGAWAAAYAPIPAADKENTATSPVEILSLINTTDATSYSVSLEDGIVINTYVDPQRLGYSHCYALVTAPDGTKSKLEPTVEEELFYFPLCRVSARHMSDVYGVQFVAYDNEAELHYGEEFELSIADYAAEQISGKIGDDADTRLLISMVNYGAEAQKYWSYNTDRLANRTVTEAQQALQPYKADNLEAYLQNEQAVAVDTDYLFLGTSTSLEDKLNLRFYFHLDTPEAFVCKTSYTDHNGGLHEETSALLQNGTGNNYYCSVPLAAADLNVPVTVTLEKKSVIWCKITDSLSSYIARAQGKSEPVTDITKAMLIYGLCAKEYSAPCTVTSITLPASQTITVDTTKTLSATVLPENATAAELTWTSSDNTIVTVDQNGKIVGKKCGQASVTAAAKNGVSATCLVTVQTSKGNDLPPIPLN